MGISRSFDRDFGDGAHELLRAIIAARKAATPYGIRPGPISDLADSIAKIDPRCRFSEAYRLAMQGPLPPVGFRETLRSFVLIDFGERWCYEWDTTHWAPPEDSERFCAVVPKIVARSLRIYHPNIKLAEIEAAADDGSSRLGDRLRFATWSAYAQFLRESIYSLDERFAPLATVVCKEFGRYRLHFDAPYCFAAE